MRRRQTVTVLLLLSAAGSVLLGACGGSTEGGRAAPPAPPAPPGDPAPAPAPPSISRFAGTDDSVFVGGHTQLTAVFSGESAEIDGLGPVVSGTPVDTPALSSSRTFTLTVHASGQTVQATVTVAARYRDRVRQLANAAVAVSLAVCPSTMQHTKPPATRTRPSRSRVTVCSRRSVPIGEAFVHVRDTGS